MYIPYCPRIRLRVTFRVPIQQTLPLLWTAFWHYLKVFVSFLSKHHDWAGLRSTHLIDPLLAFFLLGVQRVSPSFLSLTSSSSATHRKSCRSGFLVLGDGSDTPRSHSGKKYHSSDGNGQDIHRRADTSRRKPWRECLEAGGDRHELIAEASHSIACDYQFTSLSRWQRLCKALGIVQTTALSIR